MTQSTTMLDKRERLVQAAIKLAHDRGYASMTLALVAVDAGVPLGNVYYYFQTKEDLAHAVIAGRVRELRELFVALEKKPAPRARLQGFVAAFAAGADGILSRGCPYGSLTQELERRDDLLAKAATEMFEVQLQWFEAQFRAIGAKLWRERAMEFLCAIQGACLVGHALKDARVFKRRLREISRGVGLVDPDGVYSSKLIQRR